MTKTKYRRRMDYRCYNAKYAQQCFSIPTNIQNMDKMNLQYKEYTVLQKPHGENELTIRGRDKNCKDYIDGKIVL